MRRTLALLSVISVTLIAINNVESETPSSKARFEGQEAGERRELVTAMNFRWCPPGKFVMGSPPSEPGRNSFEAQQEEVISTGFWIKETEVTQGQWKTLMDTSPWAGQELVQEGSDYAASYISQKDAVDFCQKLTAREQATGQLPIGWGYALPSEAQWEYACRGGTTTSYSFGEDASKLDEYAWYGALSGDGNATKKQHAHPVGQKKPNPWGLKDMHGNVWEWCSDLNWPESRTASVSEVHHRVFRGGSWAISAPYCRSASRARLAVNDRYCFIGFRIAAIRLAK